MLKYQIHRGVDQKAEVITDTEVTPGEVHESHRLEPLIDTHEKNIETTVETAVADSKGEVVGSDQGRLLIISARTKSDHFIAQRRC